MGMGGSDAEQQAQYHPWGVSSALLFMNNASGFFAICCARKLALSYLALMGGVGVCCAGGGRYVSDLLPGILISGIQKMDSWSVFSVLEGTD